jgi:hypothetical protein
MDSIADILSCTLIFFKGKVAIIIHSNFHFREYSVNAFQIQDYSSFTVALWCRRLAGYQKRFVSFFFSSF